MSDQTSDTCRVPGTHMLGGTLRPAVPVPLTEERVREIVRDELAKANRRGLALLPPNS